MNSVPLDDWKQVISPAVDLYLKTFAKASDGNTVPTSALPTLTMIAASIKKCASGMSQWGMAELTLGLYKVACKHALEKASDTIHGDFVTARWELEEILHWLRWAMAAYEKEENILSSNLGIDNSKVLRHVIKSELTHPAYYIAVDDVRGCLVFGVRGTVEMYDILTDLTPHSEAFEGGFAHSGMLNAAKWLLEKEEKFILNKMKEYPSYDLIITGHSLGAGTAALMSMLLRERILSFSASENDKVESSVRLSPARISAWAFACPPCVNLQLAKNSNFICSVVLQDDIVARASPSALEDLRNEILQTDWSLVLQEGSMQKRIMNLVQSSTDTVSKIEPALGLPRGQLLTGARGLGMLAVNALGDQVKRQVKTAEKGEYGVGLQRTAYFFSVASTFATALTNVVAEKAMERIEEVEKHPSFSSHHSPHLSSNSPDPVIKERLLLGSEHNMPRLYVPGILYHIIRQPLEEGEFPPLSIEELIQLRRLEEGGDGGHGWSNGKKTEMEYWMQEEKQLEKEGVKTREKEQNGFFWFVNSNKGKEKGREESEGEEKKKKVLSSNSFEKDESKNGECEANGMKQTEKEAEKNGGSRNGGIGYWGIDLLSMFSKGKMKQIEEKKECKNNENGLLPSEPNGSSSTSKKDVLSFNTNEKEMKTIDDNDGDDDKKDENNNLWVDYPVQDSVTVDDVKEEKADDAIEEQEKEEEKEKDDKGKELVNEQKKESVKYVVVRGTDSASRFQRIVLSKTMISDHACGPYGDGIINALQWSYMT